MLSVQFLPKKAPLLGPLPILSFKLLPKKAPMSSVVNFVPEKATMLCVKILLKNPPPPHVKRQFFTPKGLHVIR